MEELWKVAKGDIKYQDFVGSSIPRKDKQQAQQAAAPPSVPEDLVSTPGCPQKAWALSLEPLQLVYSIYCQ